MQVFTLRDMPFEVQRAHYKCMGKYLQEAEAQEFGIFLYKNKHLYPQFEEDANYNTVCAWLIEHGATDDSVILMKD